MTGPAREVAHGTLTSEYLAALGDSVPRPKE
jgi:hypothetical protein